MHNCKTINIGMGCCHQVLGPITNYYDKWEVDELIEGIIAGDIDLSGYVTDERLAEILSEYAQNGDLEALRQRLEEEVDKLSTEVEKRAQKEDIEALDERIGDIESKIDEIEISGGVTTEKVEEMIKDKADKSEIPSLEGYATEQWVEDKNYLTEHQLKTVNGETLVGDGDIEIEADGELKEELEDVRNELDGVSNLIKYSDPTVKYMAKSEYEALDKKGNHTFYVIYDSNELWLGDNKLFPIGNGGDSDDDDDVRNYKALLIGADGNEYRIECNESSVLKGSEIKFPGYLRFSSIAIGDCVTEIDNLATYFSIKTELLTSITLSDTVEKIGNDNFRDASITELDLKNVKDIGILSFSNCKNLSKVDFGSVEVIGQGAFENCPLLYDIELPATLKEITEAFDVYSYPAVKETADLVNNNRKVRIYATEPPSTLGWLFMITYEENNTTTNIATYPIYVPDESVEKYKTAQRWTAVADRIFPMSLFK